MTGDRPGPGPALAPDVVEQGGRDPWPWRRVLALAATLLTLVGTVAVAEQALRRREASAVSTCVAEANAAIDRARGPADAMAIHTRPTLVQVSEPGTRRSLYSLVAARARGKAELLRASATGCTRVEVGWLHDDLRRRRDGCLSILEAQAERLTQVAADGQAAFGPEPPRRCG